MRLAIHIGLFIGTLIGMCACAAAPVDPNPSHGTHGSVGIGRQG
jgi:hypothetical protein